MKSLILMTAARFLLPLLLFFSVFALLRGHNAPGGGFIGGLVAAGAVVVYMVAYGVAAARRLVLLWPDALIAIGLLLALGSGMAPLLLRGRPLFTGMWTSVPIENERLYVGTPLVFDFGVYLVVLGVTLLIVFTVAEE